MVDASALVKYLTRQVERGQVAHFEDNLLAPDLLLAEVGNALRNAARRGAIDQATATLLLHKTLQMPVSIRSSRSGVERAFELRHNLSVYDGCYVALAEELGCGLLTADARLARAPGVEVPVTLV